MTELLANIGRCVVLTVALLGYTPSAHAVNLTSPSQANGNHGFVFFPVGFSGSETPFTLTAKTNISHLAASIPIAPGLAGTVDIINKGTGVQNALKQGSHAMDGSPSSPFRDEQLTATFSAAVSLNSIKMGLGNLNLRALINQGSSPWIYIQRADNLLYYVVNKLTWGAAFIPGGPGEGLVDFSLLGLPDVNIASVSIRETGQYTYLTSLTGQVAVPEPSTWAILGSTLLLGMFLKRRKAVTAPALAKN